jgi:hypothetical protein
VTRLADLTARGLVAADWAEALAPVEDDLARMGSFLREEIAAGRGYLPAGDAILRAFQRPLADVKVLIVGQDPYPTPGHPVGLSFSVAPDVRPLPGSLRNIFTELVSDTGAAVPTNGDLSAWADAGVMLLNRTLTVTPGVSNAHRARDLGARPPRRTPGRDPLGSRRAVAEAGARPDPLGRVGPPQPAVGPPRLLRFAPFQRRQPAPGRAGRRAGRLAPWISLNLELP